MSFPISHPLPSALLAGLLLFAPLTSRSEVTRVEIAKRSDVAGTDYEAITGTLHFAVDPIHERNQIIADLNLAPTDADGRVAFSSDFRLLKPKAGAPEAVAAWVEIPNRGSRSGLSDFMIAHRFAMLEVGWEFDVADDPDRLCIEVPHAMENDGSPLRGLVSAIFIVDKPETNVKITDLGSYLPIDPNGPDSRLVVREKGPFPGGHELPRETWSIAKNTVTLEGGFEPGRTYEVSWLAENPPVAGLGFAAIRDAVSWLRHSGDSLVAVPHVYAFGASQCGRFLRDFVYRGFNTDESGHPVLDGMMPHIAGAGRLDLNRRWSTPRDLALYCTASYPFADTAQPDKVSGLSEGLLENPRVTHCPRIFYTNTAAEYWGAGRVAALVHTDPEGTNDVALPEEVRLYVFAGTQHGPSAFPPESPGEGAPLANPVDFRPTLLALRLAMHRWVSEDMAPPPSAYPRLSDGTLVPAAEVAFPSLPGVASPRELKAGLRIQNPLHPEGAGVGAALPLLVPQVDEDGNDLAGIRLPEIAVPLATATGWLFRPSSMGATDELLPVLRGSWIPFALKKEARQKTADPRLSREERYTSLEEFLTLIRTAAESLAAEGYLQSKDVDTAVEKAARQWEWLEERSGKTTN